MGSKNQNYLHGAAILAAGVVIIKILGFIYKIPLGNILGDEGFADFSVAYNIYNVLLTVSTAGLPVAVSRMISEASAQDRQMQVKRVFRVAMGTFIVLGTLGTLAMYLFPTELAVMMHEVDAARSIWALSPSVVLVCVMSAYRGYAQGHGNMKPTTISQIIEVAVKVATGLALAWLLMRAGKSVPVVAAGAIFGVSIGSFVAMIYMMVSKRNMSRYLEKTAARPDVPDSRKKILIKLLKIGVPIALGSSITSIITLIDSMLVLSRLQDALGYTHDGARALFGAYSKAITVFNLPAAFITPLTISIVPALAAAVVSKKHMQAKEITGSAMRITTVLALPMGVGLTVLAEPVMSFLYPDSAAEGAGLLAILGIASYFVCMALITTAALQAMGGERLPVFSMIIGGIVKIVINMLLVANPSFGIYGAPIGTLLCYIVMVVMNFVFLQKRLVEKISVSKTLLRPFISVLPMGLCAWAVYGFAIRLLSGGADPSRMAMVIAMGAAIVLAVIVYFVMVLATRAVTAEDIKLLPKGEKIAKILKIK